MYNQISFKVLVICLIVLFVSCSLIQADNKVPIIVRVADSSIFLCQPDEICVEVSNTEMNLMETEISPGYAEPNNSLYCFYVDTSGNYEIIVSTIDSSGTSVSDTVVFTINIHESPSIDLGEDLKLIDHDLSEICFDINTIDNFENLLITGDAYYNNYTEQLCFTPDSTRDYFFEVEVIDSCGLSAIDGINVHLGTSELKFAVFPFTNFSGSFNASSIVMDNAFHQLENRNIFYVSPEKLRSVLRKHRIRMAGSINQSEIKQITDNIDVDRIIVGAINIYENRENPEISITVRIIDVHTMKILKAVTRSATGKDFEKFFGTGIIYSIDSLTAQVVETIFDRLFIDENVEKSHKTESLTVSVVPFDNLTDKKNAEQIATNILITDLAENGYSVVEPGIIKDVMQKNKRILQGEIDLNTLNDLNDMMDIDLVITGTVESFEPSRGRSQPRLEYSLRTLDASTGKILYMYSDARSGNDSESFFGFGKILSIGNLISKSNCNFINEMEKKREKYLNKTK